ncbi:MAG TPA: glycosyltransferase [Longimicrobiales bacterium]|nr:glycosyltransferase [Longimicrobiales bacterium]
MARAFAARGHDVLWATPADGVAHVQRAGITPVATGPAALAGPAQLRARFPEVNALATEDVPDVGFGKLFGAIAAPAILADLAPVALEWRPDLVVADAAEFAGHIMAAELGVPSITKGFGPLLPKRRVAAAGTEVAPLWRSRGLEPRPFGGAYDHVYLDIYPPQLTSEDARHIPRRQLMCPLSDDGHTDMSSPLPLPESRHDAPLVYVTLGTVFSDVALLLAILAALSDLDARVLVTVGPRVDPADLGPQPTHVRVEQYVPQAALLPHCDVVVSHAGSGTMLASIRHGLPQLCLPQGADQFLNATAVASAGVGISLAPNEATASAIRDAVARLLDCASYRDSAAILGRSIAAMPTPEHVAAVIETLPRLAPAASGAR